MGLCPFHMGDSEPSHRLWLQLNLRHKLSAAPGLPLEHILYFTGAYLSSLHQSPVASVAMIMCVVEGVRLPNKGWQSGMYLTHYISSPCLYHPDNHEVVFALLRPLWTAFHWKQEFNLFFSIFFLRVENNCAGPHPVLFTMIGLSLWEGSEAISCHSSPLRLWA